MPRIDPTADLFKSRGGLIALSKNVLEAFEPSRTDRFFREAVSIADLPRSEWLRERLDAKRAELRRSTGDTNLRLLESTEAPISARNKSYARLDLDAFTMDNHGTQKEDVSRTYQGYDGHTPVAAYLGEEGRHIGFEQRPGKQYSALKTEYLLERVFPSVVSLAQVAAKVLLRDGSGIDSPCVPFAHATERDRMTAPERSFDYIVKSNACGQAAANIHPPGSHGPKPLTPFRTVRPGKRETLVSIDVKRGWKELHRSFRLIACVVERSIHKKGQRLLAPKIEIESWRTNFAQVPEIAIGGYHDHGTHEQFDSEIKSSLDLHRLTAGQFDDVPLQQPFWPTGPYKRTVAGEISEHTSPPQDDVGENDVAARNSFALTRDGCPTTLVPRRSYQAGVRRCYGSTAVGAKSVTPHGLTINVLQKVLGKKEEAFALSRVEKQTTPPHRGPQAPICRYRVCERFRLYKSIGQHQNA